MFPPERFPSFLVLAACAAFASPLRAAETPGIVAGRVVSAETGAAVAGASVGIAGAAPVATDLEGAFRLPVAPGFHTLTASKPGFRPASVTGVIVVPGAVVQTDVALPAAVPKPSLPI